MLTPVTRRALYAVPSYIVFVCLAFNAFLFVSNGRLTGGDGSQDLHGLAGVFMGLLLGPSFELLIKYIKTGRLTDGQPVPHSAAPEQEQGTLLLRPVLANRRLRMWLAPVLLSLFWVAASLYCDALLGGIRTSATDKIVLGIGLNPIQYQKLLTAIGGTLYFGTFFPLLAASSVVAGWVARKALPLWTFAVPALVVYGMINYRAYAATGHTMVVHGVQQASLQLSQSHQQAAATNAGDAALIHVIAAILFAVIVFVMSVYGWLWAWISQRLSRRFYVSD